MLKMAYARLSRKSSRSIRCEMASFSFVDFISLGNKNMEQKESSLITILFFVRKSYFPHIADFLELLL